MNPTRLLTALLSFTALGFAEPVKVATFDVDATPPLGSAMAYDTVKRLDDLTLRCRGVVITGSGDPIVLCAVDWIGIANEGHDAFRIALAQAAGTTPDRVAVHALHQHDAPGCDFTAEKLIKELGVKGYSRFEGDFQRLVIARAAEGITRALPTAREATHWGWGQAIVKEVASQRRLLGPDGKVKFTRTSSTKNAEMRAEPEGVIDPMVTSLSFWDKTGPIAVLTSYACHPQSYYRLGYPTPDFPGIARFIRSQSWPHTLHVHFNGAGGNVTAGKYNDGAWENRMVLANRLADGMKEALDKTVKSPLKAADIGWSSVPVKLPLSNHLKAEELIAKLKATPPKGYISFADQLAWLKRTEEGHAIDITCLRVGSSRMVHLPGELFVEYQLAAKAMRPDLHVAVAAYGDYGPGYIGSTCAYEQGGYEVGPTSSNVAPQVEPVLIEAMKQLLEAKDAPSALPAPAARGIPKPIAVKDAAGVKFNQFELKDATLLSVMRVIRAKAYNQGELIDMVLEDPKGELAGRVVSMSLKDTTVGQVMQTLSRAADFKYTIKGNTITVEPK
jgi:hypothetical protein